MKIKLTKEIVIEDQILPVESIIEVDDSIGQKLIDEESAILYTSEEEEKEEVDKLVTVVENIKQEQKKIKTELNPIKFGQNEGIKKMKECMLGKSIQNTIKTKAVTIYASTEATEPLGIVSFDAGLAGLCQKQPIRGNLNVVYSATETTSGQLPVLDIVGENTAAATSVALTQYSAIPAKWFATVAVANEYIEDVPMMESFVTSELTNKANLVMDNSIINGAFTNNYGLKGVLNSTDSIDVGSVVLSAITIDDLHSMVDSIIPELQPKAVWVIAPATWSQLKASFLDSENINNQLITDGANKTLLGYPVKVSVVMPTAKPIVFGDFSKYHIGIAREIEIDVDKSAGFLTDATAVKVAFRLAGGPACSKKQYNSVNYGAFVYCSAD